MWGKRDDMVVHQTEPFNAEPPPAALAGPLTLADAFYSRNHGSIPQIDRSTWRLRVDGLVHRELDLVLADLQERFQPRTEVATLACAGNRRAGLMAVRDIPGQTPWGPAAISTAEWTGVRLADVLAAAGPTPGAAHIAFTAPDVSQVADPPQPFGGSIPLRKALSDEVLLAWSMNGQPLPAAHGGPVRVVVPGYIGARSVKWVQSITALAQPSDNYFQAADYRLLPPDADPTRPGQGFALGPVALTSAILSPTMAPAWPPAPPTSPATPSPVTAGPSSASMSHPTEGRPGSRPPSTTRPAGGRGSNGTPPWTSRPVAGRSPPGRGTTPASRSPSPPPPCGTPWVTATTPGPAYRSMCADLLWRGQRCRCRKAAAALAASVTYGSVS